MTPAEPSARDPNAGPLLPGKYWLPLLVAFLVTGAILGVSELSWRALNASRGEAAQGLALQSKVLELQSTLNEAVSAQRAFLLTRNPEHEATYRTAIERLRPLRAQLRDLAAHDRLALTRLADLQEAVALKESDLQRAMERARAGDFDAAIAPLHSPESRGLSERIRAQATALLAGSEEQAVSRTAEWEASVDASRSGILAVVGVNAALIALMALLLIRDTRRARENERIQASYAARLQAEVADRTLQLSSLSKFLQIQSENERANLARALHDELGGILTPAKMDVTWLEGRVGKVPDVAQRLARLSILLDSGIDVKRRIIENLRPSILDHLGLGAAVRWHVEETCETAGLKCSLDLDPKLGRLPPELEISLYRVVQETVGNVVRHARARTLHLQLQRLEAAISLEVSDDGVGLRDPAEAERQAHGISGMRQRLASVGGSLGIEQAAEGGTRVRALVPLVQEDRAAAD